MANHKTIICKSVEEMEAAAAEFLRLNNFPNERYRSERVSTLTKDGFRPEVRIYKEYTLIRTFTV